MSHTPSSIETRDSIEKIVKEFWGNFSILARSVPQDYGELIDNWLRSKLLLVQREAEERIVKKVLDIFDEMELADFTERRAEIRKQLSSLHSPEKP